MSRGDGDRARPRRRSNGAWGFVGATDAFRIQIATHQHGRCSKDAGQCPSADHLDLRRRRTSGLGERAMGGADRPQRGGVCPRQGGAGRRSSRRQSRDAAAVRTRARHLQPLRARVSDSDPEGSVPVPRLSNSARPRPGRRHHELDGCGVRHARPPAGRGGAARIGGEVRDRLSPQSATDGDHQPRRRDLSERQRRLPQDDRFFPRGGAGQEHRRARHLDA